MKLKAYKLILYSFSACLLLAIKNNWVFIASISTIKNKPQLLNNYDKEGSEFWEAILHNSIIPKWRNKKIKILKFKTGIIAFKPRNIKETEINGFAILSEACTTLNILHLWGE